MARKQKIPINATYQRILDTLDVIISTGVEQLVVHDVKPQQLLEALKLLKEMELVDGEMKQLQLRNEELETKIKLNNEKIAGVGDSDDEEIIDFSPQ